MSTAAAVVSRGHGYRGNPGDGPWTGTLRMARLDLRTGLLGLIAWPVAMAGLVWAIAKGVNGLYPDQADRQIYQATLGASPASAATSLYRLSRHPLRPRVTPARLCDT